MKTFNLLLFGLFITNSLFGQISKTPPQTKIMTLGVFHFAYHNLDAIKTEKKDQISVLEEPYQSEIIAIAKAIEEFKPTIIAVEIFPEKQHRIDSLFSLYKSDKLVLGKDEVNQLAFRIGRNLNLPTIYCVNDWGSHYDNVISIFNDSIRSTRFGDYQTKANDSIYGQCSAPKVSSIINELYQKNNPDTIKVDLANYLRGIFKYEEKPYDFTGVDFQSGRWFNRNLRIFRNVQRIPHSANDRILLIFGVGHLNLLNYFFDISKEFEFVSPLPYLENARNK